MLFGAYKDGADVTIVRIVLNHYDGGMSIDDVRESLYAVNTKKKRLRHTWPPLYRVKTPLGIPFLI